MADAVKIPIILYSIPGRCGVEIAVETVARLAAARKNIVAIKEAGGSVDRVSQLRQALPESFAIFSGDDGLTLPFLSVGAVGVISVASNIIPKEMLELVRLFRSGKVAEAEALTAASIPSSATSSSRPIRCRSRPPSPGRAAPRRRSACRSPPLGDASRAKLEATLRALGI